MYQWFKLSALLNDDQLNAHIESNNVQFILKFRTDFHCINLLDSITHVASCCSDPFFPCGSTFCFSDVFFTIPRNLLAFYRDLEILNLEPCPYHLMTIYIISTNLIVPLTLKILHPAFPPDFLGEVFNFLNSRLKVLFIYSLSPKETSFFLK